MNNQIIKRMGRFMSNTYSFPFCDFIVSMIHFLEVFHSNLAVAVVADVISVAFLSRKKIFTEYEQLAEWLYED